MATQLFARLGPTVLEFLMGVRKVYGDSQSDASFEAGDIRYIFQGPSFLVSMLNFEIGFTPKTQDASHQHCYIFSRGDPEPNLHFPPLLGEGVGPMYLRGTYATRVHHWNSYFAHAHIYIYVYIGYIFS